MDTTLYQELEAKLHDARSQLEHRLNPDPIDRAPNPPREPDATGSSIEPEVDVALIARRRQKLEAIESALRRLAAETLESCTHCGEPIAASRLRAQPTVGTCLRCELHDRITTVHDEEVPGASMPFRADSKPDRH